MKNMKHIKMPEAERGGFVKTLNQMGYMTSSPDPYSQKFIDFCGDVKAPVLEIGAAYGVATLPALEKGAYVVVNDLDGRQLNILRERVSLQLQDKLELKPGNFPDELSFPEETFSAILACRVLHLLEPAKLLSAIPLLYSWLKKKGKLFIVADTPYLQFVKNFIPTYEERLLRNEPWPGWVPDLQEIVSDRHVDLPEKVNFLDIPVLNRIFKASSFTIEEISYISRTDFPEDVRLDGRESVGIVLSKL